jgi:MFS superfamily sulfate permease-like transporter
METLTMKPSLAQQAPKAIGANKPCNGIKGLKEWRQDVPAALVVALVSVPLSLGIALASGAPPICGITSEIIAGLVFPFLGGAYVTICGPAAGLAPVLFAAITTFGRGNMEIGYHMVLGVIMMTGIVQLVLTYLKAAKFSQLFPMAAIHGMLAAIGFLLFAKQIPNLVGSKFQAHEFFAIVAETPSAITNHLQPSVFSIGIICLLLLFQLSSRRLKGGLFRHVPPQLVVVVVGVILGQLYHLDKAFLVNIPNNPLEHGIVFPDFRLLFSSVTLLPQIILFVLALTFVDGTESLATIQAVDKIDPFKRKSSPDRTLFAMGIANICSSLIGGLTIIPGIIKSTTCIVTGGRTAWVNFYNALFLITFLIVAADLIRLIPLAALSAVLMHIGYKLAGAHKWRSMAKLGAAELAVFSTTVVVTLASDLLVGIAAGMVLKVLILLWYSVKSQAASGHSASLLKAFAPLFKSPIKKTEIENGVMHVYFSGPLNCFNSLKVRATLDSLPENVGKVSLHFTPSVNLVDHSTCAYLFSFREELKTLGKDVEFVGFDDLKTCSKDATSLRRRVAVQAA